MLPPITSTCGKLRLTQRTRSSTPCEWPCAVSTTSRSTPASASNSARSSVPGPTPRAAPTRRRPAASLLASGCSVVLMMSLTVIRPRSSKASLTTSNALQAVFVDQRLAFLDGCSLMHRHQTVARGHDVSHRLIKHGLEAQVAVGDDADDELAVEHRHTRDPVQAGQCPARRARTCVAER
jgi:hypothetical protein